MVACVSTLLERVSFNCRKVSSFELLRNTTFFKNSRHFFIQSEVQPKPIVPRSHSFSRASRQLQVVKFWLVRWIVRVLCDWLEWLHWFYGIQLKTVLLQGYIAIQFNTMVKCTLTHIFCKNATADIVVRLEIATFNFLFESHPFKVSCFHLCVMMLGYKNSAPHRCSFASFGFVYCWNMSASV